MNIRKISERLDTQRKIVNMIEERINHRQRFDWTRDKFERILKDWVLIGTKYPIEILDYSIPTGYRN